MPNEYAPLTIHFAQDLSPKNVPPIDQLLLSAYQQQVYDQTVDSLACD